MSIIYSYKKKKKKRFCGEFTCPEAKLFDAIVDAIRDRHWNDEPQLSTRHCAFSCQGPLLGDVNESCHWTYFQGVFHFSNRALYLYQLSVNCCFKDKPGAPTTKYSYGCSGFVHIVVANMSQEDYRSISAEETPLTGGLAKSAGFFTQYASLSLENSGAVARDHVRIKLFVSRWKR